MVATSKLSTFFFSALILPVLCGLDPIVLLTVVQSFLLSGLVPDSQVALAQPSAPRRMRTTN